MDPKKAVSRPFGAMSRRRLIAFVLVLLLASVGLYARTQFSLEWNVASIRELVGGFGAWGPLAFIALIALRLALLIPSQVVLVVAGICFGVVWGTVYGTIGVTASGAISFVLARGLGGDGVTQRMPSGLRQVFDRGGSRAGVLLVFLGTAYPLGPMTWFHAGAGLTHMRDLLFFVALMAGALLRSLLFTFLGSRLVEHGVLGSWPALVPLGLLLLPLLHAPTRRTVVAWLEQES